MISTWDLKVVSEGQGGLALFFFCTFPKSAETLFLFLLNHIELLAVISSNKYKTQNNFCNWCWSPGTSGTSNRAAADKSQQKATKQVALWETGHALFLCARTCVWYWRTVSRSRKSILWPVNIWGDQNTCLLVKIVAVNFYVTLMLVLFLSSSFVFFVLEIHLKKLCQCFMSEAAKIQVI